MVTILLLIFLNLFSSKEIVAFWFKFHWTMFPRVQLTKVDKIIGLFDGLVPNRQQAIIWTNDGLVWLCIHISLSLKARSHSALQFDHGQNPSKSGLPWSRRCCSRWCRVYDELQSIYRRGRTRQKIGTASDAAKSFELLKILVRGQPRVAHVVKTCNTRATHVKHADNPCSGSD